MKKLNLWNADKYGIGATRADTKLEKFNEKMEGFGVESINIDEYWSSYWGQCALLYVNMGDTYIPTLCYSPITDKFYHSDWGSLVEEKLPRYIRDRII